MRKYEELATANSCINKAFRMEMIFVLLGRDQCAATAVRFWCLLRWLRGKNKWSDAQIQEALACAKLMDEERWIVRGGL